MNENTATETRPEDIEYEDILVDRDGPAFIITMNRMEKYNALNSSVRQQVAEALLSVRNDPTVRGIILWGGSRAFAAGADVTEMLEHPPLAAFRGFTTKHDLYGDLIGNQPQPVIAAISGQAFAGGLELALACDLRIASDTAMFGQVEVGVGMLPGGGATQRLTRLVGIAKAKEMILLGDIIRVDEALAMGLVNKVVPAAKLLDEAKAWVGRLAERAPLGVRMAKIMIDNGQEASLKTGMLMESLAFAGIFTTEDMREGVNAFLNKRKPNFTGT